MAAASLAAGRAELVALAEASPLYLACDWYRQWLGELRQDGTLTRLATQGEVGILAQAVHVLECLEGRPAGAGSIALPALAAQITGDTKALNHGTVLSTLVLRALAVRAGVARARVRGGAAGPVGPGRGSGR